MSSAEQRILIETKEFTNPTFARFNFWIDFFLVQFIFRSMIFSSLLKHGFLLTPIERKQTSNSRTPSETSYGYTVDCTNNKKRRNFALYIAAKSARNYWKGRVEQVAIEETKLSNSKLPPFYPNRQWQFDLYIRILSRENELLSWVKFQPNRFNWKISCTVFLSTDDSISMRPPLPNILSGLYRVVSNIKGYMYICTYMYVYDKWNIVLVNIYQTLFCENSIRLFERKGLRDRWRISNIRDARVPILYCFHNSSLIFRFPIIRYT